MDDQLMLLQVSELREFVLAELAGEGSDSGMLFEVVLEVARLCEVLETSLEKTLVVHVHLVCFLVLQLVYPIPTSGDIFKSSLPPILVEVLIIVLEVMQWRLILHLVRVPELVWMAISVVCSGLKCMHLIVDFFVSHLILEHL